MAISTPDFVWKDKAALDADFTAEGSPGSTTNGCGNTITDFDGVNDRYNLGSGLSLGSSFSIAFTILFETDTDSNSEGVLGQALGSAGSNQFTLRKDSLSTDHLVLSGFSGGGNTNFSTRESTFDYASGTEQRVFCTFAPTDDINHYRNGVLENGTLSVIGAGYTGIGGTLVNFVVGSRDLGGIFGKMKLSRIAVWVTEAVSSADVAEWDAFEAACNNPFFGESAILIGAGNRTDFRLDFINQLRWNRGVRRFIRTTRAKNSEATATFTSSWKTDNIGPSLDTQIQLPLTATGTYNFLVDWGDGNQDTITVFNQAETTHTYSVAGTFTISITGVLDGFRFNNAGDEEKLLNISEWGPLKLGNDGNYFFGCTNLTITAKDILNTSAITNMADAFRNCTSLTTVPNMNDWDVSSVTTMNSMFNNSPVFNQDIGIWDVSSVTNMGFMFNNVTVFNQDISSWNMSSVTSTTFMFRGATVFNQDISSWNMSSVTNLNSMFSETDVFNQDIGGWDVSSATNLSFMFFVATVFNQDISSWNVSSVTTMNRMFDTGNLGTTNYDLLLVAWDVLTVQSGVPFHAGSAKFSAGAPATARASLVANDLWTITDGGQAP